MGIILINSLALGAAYGFSATAVVAYASPNTTLLEHSLDENEVSWLGCYCFNILSIIRDLKITYLKNVLYFSKHNCDSHYDFNAY